MHDVTYAVGGVLIGAGGDGGGDIIDDDVLGCLLKDTCSLRPSLTTSSSSSTVPLRAVTAACASSRLDIVTNANSRPNGVSTFVTAPNGSNSLRSARGSVS